MFSYRENVVQNDTQTFLDLFGGVNAPQTFQLIAEPKDGGGWNQILHGSSVELETTLLNANNRGCGVFITVNQTDLKGRREENITAVRAMFVDLDGAPVDGVYEAAIQPHMVVESSPGRYHAYWLIDDCPLETFSSIQKALAAKFDGDPSVNDLPRLMRVPGFTHNKGKPFVSRIVRQHEGQPYRLDDVVSGLNLVLSKCGYSGNKSSEKARPKPVNGIGKVFVDGERTNELTSMLGRLFKSGLQPSDVLPITHTWNQTQCSPPLADEKISSTVESIWKTAERRNNTADPFVAAINEEYAVALQGSKTIIIRETKDGPNFMLPADFRTFIANKRSPDKRPPARYWLESEKRRQYNGIVFDPSGQGREDLYNLYTGFAVKPDTTASCELFLQHVKDVICFGNQEYADYLLDWMADAVQNPARLPGIAVALLGGQGTGKGQLVNYLGKVFGRHYLPLHDAEMLVGKHTPHLAEALLVFADEAMFQDSANIVGSLKTVITEPRRMVNPKGKDMFTVDNYVRLIMASNNDRVLPTDVDDRRFFVLSPSDKRRGDYEYFKALQHEADNCGPSALLYFLQNRDISQRQLRDVPKTGVLTEQKLLSLTIEEKWVYEVLSAGELVTGSTWPVMVPKQEMFRQFRDWLPANMSQLASISQFHKRVKAILPVTEKRPNSKQREYMFPDLETCRAAFEAYIGGEVEW